MRTPLLLPPVLASAALLATHWCAAQSLTFTSNTVAVGDEDSGPDCLAVADINGDGRQDLISANYGFRWALPGDPGGWNTNLVVLTNDGSGGFALDAVLTVGRGPSSVVAADVNGDGKPDLISADETDNTLSVLIHDGSAGFGPRSTLSVGSRPHGVAVADFNRDGQLDLACVNAGANSVTVLTGQGGGAFAIGGTHPVGGGPLALVARDANDDRWPDVITANKSDDSLTVLTNDRLGGFVLGATLPVGHLPDWVAVADFSGDGKPDLASVNWGEATMTVLTNDGSGGFGFNATLGVGSHPSSAAAADFNGDGTVDLVCASTDAHSLTVLTNNGAGVFGYNATLATGRIPNVWPADLDSDGKPDLACPNFRDGTVMVLLNTTVFPPPWTELGFWGLKTHDPLSQPPTTMFRFDENGANHRELGTVRIEGSDIEADGLAMSPRGELFAFQVNAGGGSRLLSLNATTAVASVIGPVLANRNIRGATFTLSGRLLAYDFTRKELLEISPATGQPVGAAVALSTNLDATATAGDLTQMPDGALVFANNEFLYQLDPRTGTLTQIHRDMNPFPDGYMPFCCGLACVPLSEPADKLFGYEASMDDDVYQYLPSSGFARSLLMRNVVPSYNAGRGDLAGLPAAQVDLVSIGQSGTNVTLEAVCRGGVWAEVFSSDDLAAPNWQPVPGTAGWVPFTPGTIATPMTWTHLPATAPQRFFRVRVQ